jgi:hypothetical protein
VYNYFLDFLKKYTVTSLDNIEIDESKEVDFSDIDEVIE